MSVLLAFRTIDPLRVVLACDSIEKSLAADGGDVRTSVVTEGKIRTAGRWTMAACGLGGVPGNFDTLEEFAHAARDCDTAADAIMALRDVFVRTIAPAFAQTQRTVPHLSRLFRTIHGGLIACWFAGIDSRTNLLTLGTFAVQIEGTRLSMHGGSVPGHAHDGQADFYFATGQQHAIETVKAPPTWLQTGDVDAALRLLREQHAVTPDNISPPWISVEIDATGRRTWHTETEHTQCA